MPNRWDQSKGHHFQITKQRHICQDAVLFLTSAFSCLETYHREVFDTLSNLFFQVPTTEGVSQVNSTSGLTCTRCYGGGHWAFSVQQVKIALFIIPSESCSHCLLDGQAGRFDGKVTDQSKEFPVISIVTLENSFILYASSFVSLFLIPQQKTTRLYSSKPSPRL